MLTCDAIARLPRRCRRFRALINEHGWRMKAKRHFRAHVAVLRQCGVSLEAMSAPQWEVLYRFLTREHLTYLDLNEISWCESKCNSRLGAPLQQPPRCCSHGKGRATRAPQRRMRSRPSRKRCLGHC